MWNKLMATVTSDVVIIHIFRNILPKQNHGKNWKVVNKTWMEMLYSAPKCGLVTNTKILFAIVSEAQVNIYWTPFMEKDVEHKNAFFALIVFMV